MLGILLASVGAIVLGLSKQPAASAAAAADAAPQPPAPTPKAPIHREPMRLPATSPGIGAPNLGLNILPPSFNQPFVLGGVNHVGTPNLGLQTLPAGMNTSIKPSTTNVGTGSFSTIAPVDVAPSLPTSSPAPSSRASALDPFRF